MKENHPFLLNLEKTLKKLPEKVRFQEVKGGLRLKLKLDFLKALYAL